MTSYQYTYVIDDLSKSWPGGKELFSNINLSFLPNAKIGVVGVNGSGKSTILDAAMRQITLVRHGQLKVFQLAIYLKKLAY